MKNEIIEKLKNELKEASVKRNVLMQQHIDTVEYEKLEVIEQLYNIETLKIKALNKRIVLLGRCIHE